MFCQLKIYYLLLSLLFLQSSCCSSVIRPQSFLSTDLIQYRRICSFPATILACRGIALKRLADVLDSVMHFLVGPTSIQDQFGTSRDDKYPMKSFSETSFQSSGMKLNTHSNEKEVKRLQPLVDLEQQNHGNDEKGMETI